MSFNSLCKIYKCSIKIAINFLSFSNIYLLFVDHPKFTSVLIYQERIIIKYRYIVSIISVGSSEI